MHQKFWFFSACVNKAKCNPLAIIAKAKAGWHEQSSFYGLNDDPGSKSSLAFIFWRLQSKATFLPLLSVSPVSLESNLFISFSLSSLKKSLYVLGGFISWPYDINNGVADTQTCFLFSPFLLPIVYRGEDLHLWWVHLIRYSSERKTSASSYLWKVFPALVLLSNDLRSGRQADFLM